MRAARYLALGLVLAALQGAAEEVVKAPLFASPLGAHRGGRGLWPENTAYAYEKAAARWADVLLEGDIHLSADGIAVIMHDRDVDRTTDGSGPIRTKTLEELKKLDAAYKFSEDGGKTFPLRGQGITVPTFAEGLAAAPNPHFLIELKDGTSIVEVALKVIREAKAEDRVIIASFNPLFMNQLRAQAPEIKTCFDTQSAMKLLLALRGTAWDAYVPTDDVLSFSPDLAKTMALKPEEYKTIQAKGIGIQVHTLNTEEEMRQYLELGVDSILSDYPDRLVKVIGEWRAAKKP